MTPSLDTDVTEVTASTLLKILLHSINVQYSITRQ